jgi:hypothetical protein
VRELRTALEPLTLVAKSHEVSDVGKSPARGRLMRTSFHHQSEAQPPNGPLTAEAKDQFKASWEEWKALGIALRE